MSDLLALDLVFFVVAKFAASFVAGLAGFASGIVAAAVWLHFLPPARVAALIVAFGRIVQVSPFGSYTKRSSRRGLCLSSDPAQGERLLRNERCA